MPKAKLLELLKRRKKRTEAIEEMSTEAEQMKLQAQQNQADAMDIENISQMGNQLVNQTAQV